MSKNNISFGVSKCEPGEWDPIEWCIFVMPDHEIVGDDHGEEFIYHTDNIRFNTPGIGEVLSKLGIDGDIMENTFVFPLTDKWPTKKSIIKFLKSNDWIYDSSLNQEEEM